MEKNEKIMVLGAAGMLGSAIVRNLKENGYENVIEVVHGCVELRNQNDVNELFNCNKPEYIFLAAATVGGILDNNTRRAEFIYNNLMIATNVIYYSHIYGVKKLLNLASNCCYPKYSNNPIKEEYLLTGELEPTNEPYAIAKIAAIKMCEAYRSQYGCNFISALPANLYGPNDHYDLDRCHVMPALIRKFHEGKVNNTDVVIWGDGKAKREFLYVDDCADACVFLMNNYEDSTPINIGSGVDVEIEFLASFIAGAIGFEGGINFDISKPSGTERKLLDVSKINGLGWKHKMGLAEGILETYTHIIENKIHEQWK